MIRYVATVTVIIEARGLADAAIVADGQLRDLPYQLHQQVIGVRLATPDDDAHRPRAVPAGD